LCPNRIALPDRSTIPLCPNRIALDLDVVL
jgi:hypothetical protein